MFGHNMARTREIMIICLAILLIFSQHSESRRIAEEITGKDLQGCLTCFIVKGKKKCIPCPPPTNYRRGCKATDRCRSDPPNLNK